AHGPGRRSSGGRATAGATAAITVTTTAGRARGRRGLLASGSAVRHDELGVAGVLRTRRRRRDHAGTSVGDDEPLRHVAGVRLVLGKVRYGGSVTERR